MKHKKLNIIIDIDDKISGEEFKADVDRIRQVLINLLGNALKFTFKGFIKVAVKLVSDEYSSVSSLSETIHNLKVMFAVEDTGIGIKDEEKNKLFKIFGKVEQYNNSVNP